MLPVVWEKYGNLLARTEWLPVAFGDHGKNLVISLRPWDKAKINGLAAKRLTTSQKFPIAIIRWTSFHPNFLGSRMHPLHWLCFTGPNYERWILLIPACAIDDYFERKTKGDVLQGNLVLAGQCLSSPKNCKTRNSLTWASNIMIAQLFHRIWTPRTEKNQKWTFFVRQEFRSFPRFLVERTKF